MSTRNAVVSCHKLSGLQVRGFYSNKLIPLPVTYSRTFIPANIDHIPTPETAKVWPHLEHIANEIAPLQGCDVGLLIGYNCSQALVPRQVLTGKEDQPFGLKTDLGWSIVGFGNPCLDYGDAIGLSHRIIVKQVMPSIKSSSNLSSEVHYVNRTQIKEIVSPADVIKMLESDFVEKASEDIKMSQEDIRFMTKLKESIKHKDNGHYEMPLPFKTEKPDLPNNKECAIHRLRIQRCYIPPDFKVQHHELHHFSDASASGYGMCSYLRSVSMSGQVHCSLVMGRSRVPPSKVTTIPRLELSAAVVAVRIGDMLKGELGVTLSSETYWTDSKVVLGYINNEARRFHVFVANRVERIKQSTESKQWSYVVSEENPADHASRGLTAKELITSNWFTGPGLLWQKVVPSGEIKVGEISVSDPEVKKVSVLNTQANEQRSLLDRLQKFSDWFRMIKAVARLKRFLKNAKNNIKGSSQPCTFEDRKEAELTVIKMIQERAFPQIMQSLQPPIIIRTKDKAKKLHKLCPFKDAQGILRVGGRLTHATLDPNIKHPVILPRDSHVSVLLAKHYHERTHHQGRGITTNAIRANGYWILGCSKVVASIIFRCVKCRRFRRETEQQRMADLPEERMEISPPFTYCGMDCFGPFYIKEGRKELKRYGLLITCMCSRAIHIEMLDDLTTDAFINALRAFIAIRGAVRQIRCDQGTNFVGAKNEFVEALKEMDQTKLDKLECEFLMNTPASSHMGGVWERQIRTIRSVLMAILDQSSKQLDSSSLRTFLYEVMTVVNSRPLTTDHLYDPSSPEPLTPNHILTMKSTIIAPPPGKFVQEDLYLRKRWRRVQVLANTFWTRWRREYVLNLQSRQKWTKERRDAKVNDIVLLQDDSSPRNQWKLAKTVEVYPGHDGRVRKVKLLVSDSTLDGSGKPKSKPIYLERPIQRTVTLLEAE
ncbi:uncharacterized protein LOC109516990 isoform X1 [Hippocampus comes]|uniref:uncharacterized protein LOC109516990 isoform X1 n=1 Tax=Hippocampus comes TaxID=109280 RepID=UPI00094EA9F2|nr:PREDICTED: uncharacterized protein LOC109516990 isoform X1 [Hippocampus comes]